MGGGENEVTYNEDDGIGALGSDRSVDSVFDAARQLVLLQILLDRHGGARLLRK